MVTKRKASASKRIKVKVGVDAAIHLDGRSMRLRHDYAGACLSGAATDAAAVAHGGESDLLEARLLGLVEQESLAPSPNVPLAIDRWLVAQRPQGDWEALQRSGVPGSRSICDACERLRSAERNGPTRTLEGSVKGRRRCDKNGRQTSIDEIFTSLSNIGAALSAVDDKYNAFRKTID